MSRDQIIEKIKKLLSLAGNNPSEHEAAVAASQARKMMDKYQISKMEVEQFDTSEFGSSYYDHGTSRLDNWKSCLALEVGKYNDVVVHLTRRPPQWKKPRIIFSGYEVDAILATVLFEYLCQAIEHRTDQAKRDGIISGRRQLNSFRWGAASALIDRLQAIREAREEEMQAPTENGTSLMVFKRQNVANKFGEQREGKARVRTDAYASQQGHKAGSKISLDPQVTNQTTATKRLN